MSYSKVHPATDYKVMGHDEHSYTVQHPDGHHFKVAKHGLSDELHSKIQSFSGGGMAQPEDSVNPQEAWDSIISTPSGDSPVTTEFDPILAAKNKIGPSPQLVTDSPPPIGSQLTQDQLAQNTSPQSSSIPKTNIDQDSQDPFKKSQDQFEGAIGEQEAGLAGGALEQEKLGNAQAPLYHQEALDQKKMGDKIQTLQTNMNKENDKIYQDVASSKIDPRRLWNAPTTNRLQASVALILGGLGGGISGHGGNAALDVINNAISQDIDAQKANMENKHSLLNYNLRKFGDEKMATLATANQYASATKGLLAEQAAKAQGPLAKQNALVGIGQLDQQIANRTQQLALLHASNLLETSIFDKSASVIATPEQKKRAVILDNGKMALATTEEAGKDVKDTLTNYTPIMKHLNILDSLQGLKAFTPENAAAAKSAGAGLSLELDRLHGLKRISDAEYERSKEQIGNPATLKGYLSGQAARNTLRDTIESEKDSTLKNSIPAYKSSYGIAGTRPTGKKIK